MAVGILTPFLLIRQATTLVRSGVQPSFCEIVLTLLCPTRQEENASIRRFSSSLLAVIPGAGLRAGVEAEVTTVESDKTDAFFFACKGAGVDVGGGDGAGCNSAVGVGVDFRYRAGAGAGVGVGADIKSVDASVGGVSKDGAGVGADVDAGKAGTVGEGSRFSLRNQTTHCLQMESSVNWRNLGLPVRSRQVWHQP